MTSTLGLLLYTVQYFDHNLCYLLFSCLVSNYPAEQPTVQFVVPLRHAAELFM